MLPTRGKRKPSLRIRRAERTIDTGKERLRDANLALPYLDKVNCLTNVVRAVFLEALSWIAALEAGRAV